MLHRRPERYLRSEETGMAHRSNELSIGDLGGEPIRRDGTGLQELVRRELDEDNDFEKVLAEFSARFINLPTDQLDNAIAEAQRLICESLRLDRSTLFQRSAQEPENLFLTHWYLRPGTKVPAIQHRPQASEASKVIYVLDGPKLRQSRVRIEVTSSFPWIYQQLRKGQTVVIPNVEAMPPEATLDRKELSEYGTKSSVIVPLFTGGEWVGCLTFASMRDPRDWPLPIVRRFEFVANVFTNALARKQAESALRESEARLALATESAGAGLWSIEAGTLRIWATARCRELFQFDPAETLDYQKLSARIHPEDRERVGHLVEAALATGGELRVDYRIVVPEGGIRWISACGRRQTGSNSTSARLMGASIDVTERRRAEEQLRESEQRFRTLVEQAGDGFELLDEAGKYLDINAATLQQLGYTREEILAFSVFDVDVALKREQFERVQKSLPEGGSLRIESVHRRKDGSTFPVEVTISIIQLGGRRCTLTLVRDITERKLAHEALTRSYAEIEELKDRLQAERDYLKSEFKVSQGHGQIIGRSKGIRQVLHLVEQVAPADCAVLVSGETGTGKELIAQEIHRLSPRNEQVMVLVNCAALPSALVESELFGRERGAYTGALTTQVGRFEVANNSSIFLDEIGDLSMEVQAKLLRVLQQGEFQRLGSPKTYKVDVRVIAATNRDLAEDVRKGRFREDLYYRLKVFPIHIPPLRERIEDIPLLAFAFMEEFSTRMGKKITKIPRKAMETLQNHSWQGNIREFRNVIEHSVIVTSGDTLKLTLLGESPTRFGQPVTLAEAERDHILKTLQNTAWRIKGPHGAAARLGLQPSTLYSRMQKLGIPHRRQKDEMTTHG